jgi:hypothetical protein
LLHLHIVIIFVLARIRPGDELRLETVEAEPVDKPRERFPRNATAEEKRKKRYMIQMAKKLGWKIQRPRKSR